MNVVIKFIGVISFGLILFAGLARVDAAEISDTDKFILSSEGGIAVVILEFAHVGGRSKVEEKPEAVAKLIVGGKSQSYVLEPIKIDNVIYWDPTICVSDARFFSDEIVRQLPNAWMRQVAQDEGFPSLRELPIDSVRKIVVLRYKDIFGEFPFVFSRVYSLAEEKIVREVLANRKKRELPLVADMNKYLKEIRGEDAK